MGVGIMEQYTNIPMTYIDLRELYLQVNNLKDNKKDRIVVTLANVKQMLKAKGYKLKRIPYYHSGKSKCYYLIVSHEDI